MNLFTTINQEGQTIVMVTHSVKVASSAKRVLLSRTEKYSISFTGGILRTKKCMKEFQIR